MRKRKFERLTSFFGSWFHQDFDIVGDTIEELVDAYKATADAAEIQELVTEIDQFRKEHGERVELQLEKTFDLEVDPRGFAKSADDFLLAIRARLVM